MIPAKGALCAVGPLCLILLSACATASSQTLTEIEPGLAGDSHVREVHVSATEESGVSAGFAEAMTRRLESDLSECATGERPLRVDVVLNRAKRSNPLVSAFMTDTNEVAGEVTIYSLETGETVGRYDAAFENRGGLGAGGALLMAARAQNQMTNGFAGEICRRVFNGGGEESVQSLRLF